MVVVAAPEEGFGLMVIECVKNMDLGGGTERMHLAGREIREVVG